MPSSTWAPTGGPFPSNWFTVPDASQNTGRRVNLPLPDPGTNLSDYQDTKVLNTLDGFNMQLRLSVPFDGPIDVNTVNSHTVFVVSLGDTLNPQQHRGEVVGINQVVWDPASNGLHVESDALLEQHTRYALIVTNGIHEANGNPVEATQEFRHFRRTVYGGYNHDLRDAIHAARRLGVRERDIVTASVFSTQSATAVLEKIRDQIHAATPAPAGFLLGSGATRTVFNLEDVTGIHWEQQSGDNPPTFTPVDVQLPLMRLIPGAIGEIAFGKYLSPDYEVHPNQFIPPVATRTGTPIVQGENEVYFNLGRPRFQAFARLANNRRPSRAGPTAADQRSRRSHAWLTTAALPELHEGQDYLELKPTISINFLDPVLFPQVPDYHQRFRLLETIGPLLKQPKAAGAPSA